MVIRRNRRLEWIARNRLHPEHSAVLMGVNGGDEIGPSGLVRKRPHDIGFIGPNGIKRIDRLGNSLATMAGAGAHKGQAEVSLPLYVVENASQYVAVVLDAPEGRLSEHDKDLLGLAQQLKAAADNAASTAVAAIIFSSAAPEAARIESYQLAGVDRLIVLPAESDDYQPEQRAAQICALTAQYDFIHLCFPDTVLGGADTGRRVAANLAERPATSVWKLDGTQLICRGAAGKTDITRPLSKVIIALEQCADQIDESKHECLALSADAITLSASRIEDLGKAQVNPNDIDLTEANFILSGGNGIEDWDRFHEAARLLGATEGASRVAVDDGFMPRERQVGATGKWVTARVYIAVGISGAIQHMQGIGQCDKVIAINTDDSCDMVKRADLSIIADSDAILTALIETLSNQSSAEFHPQEAVA
ncbi:electron transfer flavoprotein subunit alpha/FixB family protein [Alteromonas lipolytica]|uniref:Electron transfer flavoprotein subunit alpha n=1 Tax=Alteromonas lipolytica TaxID=1856405 RepID=A0A1E8FAG2_9ALTE|nr:electron transfer flavoprotein subunit alpha/FixB family protein [Alteromonas lipolytica]OFI32917.1 electron transfer flavoprotein subunit alpha [Alteromonas lipolytica]GGF64227.1 electron transfer flavoprotein subunit alpha [Alteromonas lipolytica]